MATNDNADDGITEGDRVTPDDGWTHPCRHLDLVEESGETRLVTDGGEKSCRLPTCTNSRRGSDADGTYAGKFCSAKCEVKYDHLKADARDARMAEEGRR
jgi:hypothetical protein